MPPRRIDLLRVRGTERDVGRQMGEAAREQIRAEMDASFEDLPAGRSMDEQLALAAEYRGFTEPRLPWLVEPLAFFATTIEEIWYEPRGRGSDLVATAPATADGHLIVGHTNDLRPAAEDAITAIEIRVPGEPVVFQLGGVPWLSVGWNDAGLSLTGNELSPNDERIGISRSHQVLDMLRARTLGDMVGRALRADRASSYNNVLCSSTGEVANVEGSATDSVVTGTDERGHAAHTNHYVAEHMLPFEGDPDYAKHSQVRYDRACDVLAAQPDGSITMASMRELLSDHESAPDSVCRHPHGDSTAKTVFWCVADVTVGEIHYGRGNPCDSVTQTYRFDPYAA